MNKQKEIEKIKECIQDLVYEKVQLKKAYNYYHCIRDAEQFRHIEDNYGIGVPTSIGFNPLVKKHIDVLVGEYLELDPDLQVTCKDPETVSNILRDKKLKIDYELYEYLRKYLQNQMINIIMGSQEPVNDPFVEKELERIKDNIDSTFVSDYEIAAQNILAYIKNSRDIDLKNKMRELFTDLLICGICYYRTKPSGSGDNIVLEILNPLDTFIERNRKEFYLNKSRRAVVRRWMTREDILSEFGEELNAEARKKLEDNVGKGERNYNTVYVRAPQSLEADGEGYTAVRNVPSPGILGGLEVTPVFSWNDTGMYNYNNNPVLPVYECEWLEWDHEMLIRHEGVQIGEDIYITRGESKTVVRSRSNPKECTLSINGMFFSDKNGMPFSMMLSTMDLQDKFDLLCFYRDNLIASSGTVGDWIDLAHLPEALGVELPERLEKWIAYKKTGVALFDSSQEGANILNTTFNGYDDTLKAQSIQAIQIAIDAIEQNVANTTGVFPEKLGQIQERDAVSNVKVGLRYSTLLTKQYFHAMDLMYKEANYDLLNLAKIVFPNGMSGTIILGERLNKVFQALPQHYTMTDYDIHIQDSTETMQMRQEVKALTTELIKSGQADVDIAIKITTAKNMTQLKRDIEHAIAAKKAENNMIQQLQQQVEQLNQQVQQLNNTNSQLEAEKKRLENQLDKNSDIKWELERQRVVLEERELRDKKDYNDKLIETKEKQLEVEIMQLNDGNPYNDTIRKS